MAVKLKDETILNRWPMLVDGTPAAILPAQGSKHPPPAIPAAAKWRRVVLATFMAIGSKRTLPGSKHMD